MPPARRRSIRGPPVPRTPNSQHFDGYLHATSIVSRPFVGDQPRPVRRIVVDDHHSSASPSTIRKLSKRSSSNRLDDRDFVDVGMTICQIACLCVLPERNWSNGPAQRARPRKQLAQRVYTRTSASSARVHGFRGQLIVAGVKALDETRGSGNSAEPSPPTSARLGDGFSRQYPSPARRKMRATYGIWR